MKAPSVIVLASLLSPKSIEGFSTPPSRVVGSFTTQTVRSSSPRLLETRISTTSLPAADLSDSSTNVVPLTPAELEKKDRKALIRQEGGRFAFNTKYGALNPFAIYYGLVAISLGIPWFIGLTAYQLFRVVTFNRVDPQRRFPQFITHIWGVTLMLLTRCFPKVENRGILNSFNKEKRPAMFVTNHNSWMDIPFLGYTVGWRNYKLISKKELRKVPILGKAIEVGGNLMVDRSSRKSGLKTLRQGMQYLKDGVCLCTFPEGTRSRSGRLGKFKNGAFKMAHKEGAPVFPISIVGAAKCHPAHWIFPNRPAHSVAKMVVHDPVESKGRTEDELAAAVRKSIIDGLPEEQRPEGE